MDAISQTRRLDRVGPGAMMQCRDLQALCAQYVKARQYSTPESGDPEALLVQIEQLTKADPPPPDILRSVLTHAAVSGHVRLTRVLLEAGGDVYVRHVSLAYACREIPEVAVLLIDYGADVHQVDPFSRNETVLHVAAEENAVQVARRLLQEGVAVEPVDDESRTPLHYAALAGHCEMIQLLVDHGASVAAADEEGPPVRLAALAGKTPAVELLLDLGSPAPHILFNAISFKSIDTVEMLIARGCDVNEFWENPNTPGLTPLHWACAHGHTQVAEVLLRAGALWDRPNNFSDTAADVALQQNQVETAKVLTQWGWNESVLLLALGTRSPESALSRVGANSAFDRNLVGEIVDCLIARPSRNAIKAKGRGNTFE